MYLHQVKSAMVKLEKELKLEGRMLLQVHDEVLFEVESCRVEDLVPKIKTCMESLGHDFQMKVSTPVKIMTGKSRGRMKEWCEEVGA